MSKLDKIRARLEATTPGPWEWFFSGCTPGKGSYALWGFINGKRSNLILNTDEDDSLIESLYKPHPGMNDIAFIVAAPDDITFLLAEVNRLKKIMEDDRKYQIEICHDCTVKSEKRVRDALSLESQ